jgi:hypothetical protein
VLSSTPEDFKELLFLCVIPTDIYLLEIKQKYLKYLFIKSFKINAMEPLHIK